MRELTDPGKSTRATVLDETVLRLPWLAPGAASLVALCHLPASSLWSQVCHDPAMVLLLARQSTDRPTAHFSLSAAAEHAPLFDDILNHLRQPPTGAVNWDIEPARTILAVSHACAYLARELSQRSGLGQPEYAWTCGLLAPLGWLLLCAVDPLTTEELLRHPKEGPLLASLARRVARNWNLPGYLTAVAGFLALPEAVASSLGGDAIHFHLTRIAVQLAQEQGHDLGLLSGNQSRESALALSLSPALLAGDWVRKTCQQAASAEHSWRNPYEQQLLHELLSVAADNRRLRSAPRLHSLEQEIDHLQSALEGQVESEGDRLHTAKLEALAEFAAGAGHEINNPLAVVSGQAQYLLGHEANWFVSEAQPQVRKALLAIIAQTRRMHSLLRDLMLFARPSAPSRTWADLPILLGEVATSLRELAEQRQVRIEVDVRVDRFSVYVDAEQIRQVLSCLFRNAVEAASAEGWARLVLHRPRSGQPVEIAVEDSGSGPDLLQQPHLFDPFYSGRSAGRGRGLGLPIAWRLARLNGGSVRLETPTENQPTRFLLHLPWTESDTLPSRLAC